MFANTQMMGTDMRFPQECKQKLFRVHRGIEQAAASGSLSPDAAALFREMHGVLEAVVAHSINQSSVIEAQRKLLTEMARRR